MLRRIVAGVVAGLAVLASAANAEAAWYKAETDRFVVYGEGREGEVRDYALKLQTFDAMLRLFHPSTLDTVPATKVQVYLVDGLRDLRRMRPSLGAGVHGFYAASNEGVIAAVATERSLEADDVLFHEYAHHFMLENFPAAYPAWFVEGFAEYFMTAEITDEGVKVGGYNPQRAAAVFLARWLPWEEVFSKTTAETHRRDTAAYYSQAWLLAHYMYSDRERAAQLDKAITAIAGGAPPVEAFQAATGMDSRELTRVLRRYDKLQLYLVRDPLKTPPAMTVTRLQPSADEFLLDHVRLLFSRTGRLDQGFLDSVRRRAARLPDDPFAQRTLARAEYVMGDVAAGEAIMKAQLAARPDDLETVLLAGMGQVLAGLREPQNRQQRFRAGRPFLAKAYALDKRDFRPLYAYGLARSVEPEFPTDNDMTVLLEARALAPSVQENSVRAGLALLKVGRKDDARKVLAAVINNPHGGGFAARARALLEGASESEAEAAGQAEEAPPDETE